MSKMRFTVSARHTSPTLQPVPEVTTSSAHQFAQSTVFVSPMPQSTPSIRYLKSPSEWQLSTSVEVLPEWWEPADAIQKDVNPIKQELLSSSPVN